MGIGILNSCAKLALYFSIITSLLKELSLHRKTYTPEALSPTICEYPVFDFIFCGLLHSTDWPKESLVKKINIIPT
jgi:hypothetical protein